LGDRLVFARKASGLIRELTPLDVIIWAIGAPAVTGFLYFAPRSMYLYGLWGIVGAYVLSLLLLIPIAITLALAVAAMPRAGGPFPMMSRILSPSLTFLIGWIRLFGFGFVDGIISCVGVTLFGSTTVLYGTLSHNTAVIDLGAAFLSPTGILVGGLVFILGQWALTLFSMRIIKWLERALFIVPLIILAIMLVYLFAYGGATYASMFDSVWGTGVTQSVIAQASHLGFTQPGFTVDRLMLALNVGIFAFGGYEIILMAGGEVKSPRRSLLYGLVGGFLCVAVLYIISALAVGGIGDFANSYSFLYYAHNADLRQIMKQPVEASLPFFAASAMPLWLSLLIPPFAILWIIKSLLPYFIGNSRLIFSLSMDRTFPARFANVNKYGSPTWATHLQAVLAVVGVLAFTQSITMLLAITTASALMYNFLFGLAMIVFPFIRRDIFEKSSIQWRVGGFPVISLLGILTTVIGFFIFTFSITLVNTAAVTSMCLFLGLGLAIHVYQLRKNEKEGVSLADIYSQMPPE
jgi:APA family basic amino acid/polyamine antiporter